MISAIAYLTASICSRNSASEPQTKSGMRSRVCPGGRGGMFGPPSSTRRQNRHSHHRLASESLSSDTSSVSSERRARSLLYKTEKSSRLWGK